MAKIKITPGPYTVEDLGYGCRVIGLHGVGVAWCSTAGVYGVDGSHTISEREAKANAEAIAAALTKIWEGKGNG